MKQPKVYIKSLDMVLPVEVINYHEKTVEVYFNDNADNVPYSFDEVEFIENAGYKDMNDNDIYIGDVILLEELKFVVRKSEEKEFYYLTHRNKRTKATRIIYLKDGLSVIGNIYENRELLEV